ncbi:MAG: tetratricopeptide repeat protein [Myxococcales bacterium]|nr:tetratricopeptide repeat protein [Myxococcales bacterium]
MIEDPEGGSVDDLKQLASQARENPKNSVVWFKLARGLLQGGFLSAAREAIEKGSQCATHVMHWIESGELYEQLDDRREAMMAYQEATQLHRKGQLSDDVTAAIAYGRLGRVLLEMGDSSAAILSLRVAVQLVPNDEGLRVLLAEATCAVDHSSSTFSAPLGKGRSLIAEGRLDEARQVLLPLSEESSHSPEISLELSQTLLDIGEPRIAARLLRSLIQEHPALVEAKVVLADALISSEQLEEAISEYEAAVALKPNIAAAHRGLGLAYAANGQTEASIRSLISASALVPDDDEIRSLLAWVIHPTAQAYKRGMAPGPLNRLDEIEDDSYSDPLLSSSGAESLNVDLAIFDLASVLELALRRQVSGQLYVVSDGHGAGEITLLGGYLAWASTSEEPFSLHRRMCELGLIEGEITHCASMGDKMDWIQWLVTQSGLGSDLLRSEIETPVQVSVGRMLDWTQGRVRLFVWHQPITAMSLRSCVHPHELVRAGTEGNERSTKLLSGLQ